MSWFQSANIATFAKSALKEAQKTIDKALDIGEGEEGTTTTSSERVAAVTEAATDFFASWGVGGKKSTQPSTDQEEKSWSTEQKSKSFSTVSTAPRRQSLQSESSSTTTSSSLDTTQTSTKNSSSVQQLQPQAQHKRASSLETSQGPWSATTTSCNSTDVPTPINLMHRSLTSDIPVTLLAPSESSDRNPQTDSNLVHPYHHSRSLSDTVFNSASNFIDNFEGQVEDLDETNSPSNFNFILNERSSNSLPPPLLPQPLLPSETSKSDNEKSNNSENSVTSTTSATSVATYPELSEGPSKESVQISDASDNNFATTTTIEAGTAAAPVLLYPSAEDIYLTNVSLNSTDADSPFSNADSVAKQEIRHDEDSDSHCDNSYFPDSVENDPFSESKGSVKKADEDDHVEHQSEIKWETDADDTSLITISSEVNLDKSLTPTEVQPEEGLIGDISSSSEATVVDVRKNRSDESEERNQLEHNYSPLVSSPEEKIKDENEISCSHVYSKSEPGTITSTSEEFPDEDSGDTNGRCENSNIEELIVGGLSSPIGASSPPASSISIIDSPRSSSPTNLLNHFESQRESPTEDVNPFDTCEPVSSNVQEQVPLTSEEAARSEASRSSGQEAESSRSSSIVVVSSCRNSTPSSSGGSTGSDGHQDIEDHSNSSTGFDHIELPGRSNRKRTSRHHHEDLRSHHHHASETSHSIATKRFVPHPNSDDGHQEGSFSSDMEIIPSNFAGTGKENKSCLKKIEIIREEKDTQTDFAMDEATQREQELPKTLLPDIEEKSCLKEEQIREEKETQTDFAVDEAALLEQELPKKLTLEISEMLSEKDEMIKELREEGEKLSKKQFEMSQIVKKLRTKEKESETTIKLLKGELAGKSIENERLMKSFVNKESVEHSQNENISKLNSEKRNLELRIEQMRSEVEDANENCARMKASLEDASIEILELKNAISSSQRDSTELDSLTREKSELISRNESLQKEVENLRSTINSSQVKSSTRESELQSQITKLTEKVHQYEDKLSEFSSEMADATMPLSLEIEKLQKTIQLSNSQNEKRESALLAQITELNLKLKSSQEREKSYKDLTQSLQSSTSNFELKLEELERENKKLEKGLRDSVLSNEKTMADQKQKFLKTESHLKRVIEEVERLSKENEMLGMELKSEKSAFEQERKKSQSAMEQLVTPLNVNRNQFSSHNQHHIRTNSISGGSVVGGNNNNANAPKSGENSPSSNSVISEVSYLDEVFDHNGQLGHQRSMTPKSFFESFSSVGLIENLQSQLRQRETEVLQFQDQVAKNEKIRKSLNEEIAKLTMQNQEVLGEMEALSDLKTRLEELEKNYNALLQMYGEKVEEADELRMDLQDVKDMYKVQIEQLLKK